MLGKGRHPNTQRPIGPRICSDTDIKRPDVLPCFLHQRGEYLAVRILRRALAIFQLWLGSRSVGAPIVQFPILWMLIGHEHTWFLE